MEMCAARSAVWAKWDVKGAPRSIRRVVRMGTARMTARRRAMIADCVGKTCQPVRYRLTHGVSVLLGAWSRPRLTGKHSSSSVPASASP